MDADNLAALSIATIRNPVEYFTDSPLQFPAYRPIPYLTLWIQEAAFGVSTPSLYFATNILIWFATGVCAYALLFALTSNQAISAAVALAYIVDERATWLAIWIGERQMAIACLLGVAALLLALRPSKTSTNLVAIAILLFLSALSKEYGLAFSAAVAVVALTSDARGKRLALVAIGVVAAYAGSRTLLAGATPSYCESMGFGFTSETVCYSDITMTARVRQYAYNSGASLIGTWFPNLFTFDGVMHRPSARTAIVAATHLPLALLSAVGVVHAKKRALPFIALIVSNALLSFFIYRSRNQLPGFLGVVALAAIGTAYLRSSSPRRWLVASAAVLLTISVATQGALLTRRIEEQHLGHSRTSLCASMERAEARISSINPNVVEEIARSYGLEVGRCIPARSGARR